MRCLFTFFVVLSFASPILAEEEYESSSRVWLTYSNANIRVNSLPLYIRDIPIHPDDTYASQENSGPIEKERFTISHFWSIDFGTEWTTAGGASFGYQLDWIPYPVHYTYDNALRNYTNAVGTETRGYGAALTFAGLEIRGMIPPMGDLDFFFNWSPELFYEVTITDDKSWKTGVSLGYLKLQAVNGWDRYDSLEVKDRYTLAKFYPLKIYIKHGNSFQAGIRLMNMHTTESGKESELDIDDISFYISFSSG